MTGDKVHSLSPKTVVDPLVSGLGTGPTAFWVSFIVFALLVLLAKTSVVVIKAGKKGVLTVRGKCRKRLEPGIHFTPPVISKAVSTDVSQSVEVPKQEAITQDSVPVTVDATLDIKVTDGKKAFQAPENADRLHGTTDKGLRIATRKQLQTLAAGELRGLVGELDHDYVLSDRNREEISGMLTARINEQTEKWGIIVNHFELKDITTRRSNQ